MTEKAGHLLQPTLELAGKSKLQHLNPVDLIPPGLEELIGNPLRVHAVPSEGNGKWGVRFVITDNEVVDIRKITHNFTYLHDFDIPNFPELQIGTDSYLRPILHGSLDEHADILNGAMIETNNLLRNKGVGIEMQSALVDLAKKLGFSFIAGNQNNEKLARFFLNRGRYLLEEIKEEEQARFQWLIDEDPDYDVFRTVMIVNPEDVEKYVKPDRVGASVDDKIKYREMLLEV